MVLIIFIVFQFISRYCIKKKNNNKWKENGVLVKHLAPKYKSVCSSIEQHNIFVFFLNNVTNKMTITYSDFVSCSVFS